MKVIHSSIEGAACAYFLAYKCVMEKNKELCNFYHDRISAYFYPAVSLAALSCEIALKSRIKDECGKDRRGHDLKKLFDELKLERQIDLKSRTIRLYNSKEQILGYSDYLSLEVFDQLLNDSKDVFVNWRYFYENANMVNLDFLEAFMFCLNDIDDDYIGYIKKQLTDR